MCSELTLHMFNRQNHVSQRGVPNRDVFTCLQATQRPLPSYDFRKWHHFLNDSELYTRVPVGSYTALQYQKAVSSHL